MYQSKISVRYAKACFEAAPAANVRKEAYDDFSTLAVVLNNSPELRWLLSSPIIAPSRKFEILVSAFAGTLRQYSQNCLQLIFNQGRESYLAGIMRNFIDLYRKSLNIQAVTITTAHSLTPQQLVEITRRLSESLNSEIVTELTVNPALIGGFVLQFDHRQYDASVAGQLKEIRKKIHNR